MCKREKVIKGLECCIGYGIENTPGCEDCSYNDMGDTCERIRPLYEDAIALLKAQEPRLVTELDFNSADEDGYIPAWTEEKDGDMYCECIPKAAITDPDGIGVLRYWTSRPTKEQREATPWN